MYLKRVWSCEASDFNRAREKKEETKTRGKKQVTYRTSLVLSLRVGRSLSPLKSPLCESRWNIFSSFYTNQMCTKKWNTVCDIVDMKDNRHPLRFTRRSEHGCSDRFLYLCATYVTKTFSHLCVYFVQGVRRAHTCVRTFWRGTKSIDEESKNFWECVELQTVRLFFGGHRSNQARTFTRNS